MNRTTSNIALGALVILSAALCAAGISYGLPSERRSRAAFESPRYSEALYTLINERRNAIYRYYSAYTDRQMLHNRVPEGGEHNVIVGNRRIRITDAQLDITRSFLLQSELPDESHTLKVVAGLRDGKNGLNPHFFIYGGMFLYSVGAVIKAASLTGAVKLTSDAEHYLKNPEDASRLFIIPKLFTILLFVLSIPLLFTAAERMYSRPTALLAAAFYAFTPVTIVYAHLLKPHVLALCWATCCVWASSGYAPGQLRRLCVAGFFSGLAGGTFIYSSSIFLFPLGLVLFSGQNRRTMSAHIAALSITGIAGFFIVNPYWILDYRSVLADISQISAADSATTASRLFFSPVWFARFFVENLTLKGVGLTTGLLFYAGLIRAATVKNVFDKAALFFVLPFLIFSALSAPAWWQSDLHMSLAAVPVIAVLGARFLTEILSPRVIPAVARNAALCCAVGLPLLQCYFYSSLFTDRFTKETASEWIIAAIPSGASFSTERPYSGGYGGYPALPTTKYIFLTRSPSAADSDYYLTCGHGEEAIPNRRYALHRTFARERSPLDNLFSARILPIIDQRISVYKRVS